MYVRLKYKNCSKNNVNCSIVKLQLIMVKFLCFFDSCNLRNKIGERNSWLWFFNSVFEFI